MSWRALRGADGSARRIGVAPEGILAQGTLLLECDGAALARAKGAILRVDPRREPQHIFAIDRRRDRELSMLLRNGGAASHLSVTMPDASDGLHHLTYRWRCETGDSILTLDGRDSRTVRWSGRGHVPPITGEQIATLFTSRQGAFRHPAITGFAFSDHVMPIGPLPGLLAGASLATLDGPRSVETLRQGDLVLTADNGWQPVLWQGGVELPALPGFFPIRLLAPYHGLDHDLVVLPEQRIAISGKDVEYLFGADRVLVAARDLVDGRTAMVESLRTATLRCHSIVLERSDVIRACGGWVQSLDLGTIAKHAERAALSVCGDLHTRGAMPLHARPPCRSLQAFEVKALKQMREKRRAPTAV